MQKAIDAQVSFSKSLAQTILFNHRDPSITDANLDAARGLARSLGPANGKRVRSAWVFEGVQASVVPFLRGFLSIPPRRTCLALRNNNSYIEGQIADGLLREWSVVFAGAAGGRQYELVEGLDLELTQRSRLVSSDSETARVGVITSASDLTLDLDDAPKVRADIDEIPATPWRVPLLLIYVIDALAGTGSDHGPAQPSRPSTTWLVSRCSSRRREGLPLSRTRLRTSVALRVRSSITSQRSTTLPRTQQRHDYRAFARGHVQASRGPGT